MSRLFVPMTKATGLGNMPDLLEQWAGSQSVARTFGQAGLPMEVIEFSETWIPVDTMRNLLEISARAAGDRCFGLYVGKDMTHKTFGMWMKYSGQAATLKDGLSRASRSSKFQQSGGKIVFTPGARVSFWRYIPPPMQTSSQVQHCDHLIWPTIQFIQSYLGPGWLPEWVDVTYPRDPGAHLLEARLPFPVRFGAPYLSLAIRNQDLLPQTLRPSDAGQRITFDAVRASEATGPTKEPLGTVFNTITLRLLEGQTDIDGAACQLGIGVQRLQRNLRREGVDYRDLLNRAKRVRAQELLSDTDMTVIDIALSLGYSDHGNFSRAFRKMTGIAPSGFRATHLRGPERSDWA